MNGTSIDGVLEQQNARVSKGNIRANCCKSLLPQVYVVNACRLEGQANVLTMVHRSIIRCKADLVAAEPGTGSFCELFVGLSCTDSIRLA